MSDYAQAVVDSILPLSAGDSLPEAFGEWSFSGEIHDHEQSVATCELCGQKKLRYHFGIDNRHTRAHLWIGSHCILRFELPVFEKGRQLSMAEAKSHLASLERRMEFESCLRALQRLAASEDNRILSGALEYFERKGKLTPKLAFVVFWKLEEHGIEHRPSFFGIELRRERHLEDLRTMPTDHVHRFWKALTPAQREKAQELGHPPPPPPPPPLPPMPPRARAWPVPGR